MKYVLFQKINKKIQSVYVNVKKIGKHEVQIVDGVDTITLKSNFILDSNLVYEGPEITVIAMYIYRGRLFPLGPDDAINLEEDDVRFLSNQMKGKVYSNEKITGLIQEQQESITELKKLLDEKQLLTKLQSIVGTPSSQKTVIDLNKI